MIRTVILNSLAIAAGTAHALTLPAIDSGTVQRISVSFVGPTIIHDAANQTLALSDFSVIGSDTRVGYAWFASPASDTAASSLVLAATVAGAETFGASLAINDVALPLVAYAVTYSSTFPEPVSADALALYSDLTSGVSYGDGIVVAAGTTTISVVLPASAVAAFNGAAGGAFGLAFVRARVNAPLPLLTLTDLSLTVTPVPEIPSALALLAGLGLLAGRQVRMRR